MRKSALILFAVMAISAFAADTTVKGYLVDLACAAEDGQKAGFGAKHSSPDTPFDCTRALSYRPSQVYVPDSRTPGDQAVQTGPNLSWPELLLRRHRQRQTTSVYSAPENA